MTDHPVITAAPPMIVAEDGKIMDTTVEKITQVYKDGQKGTEEWTKTNRLHLTCQVLYVRDFGGDGSTLVSSDTPIPQDTFSLLFPPKHRQQIRELVPGDKVEVVAVMDEVRDKRSGTMLRLKVLSLLNVIPRPNTLVK